MSAGGSHGAGGYGGTRGDPLLRLTEPRGDVHDALADLFLGPTPAAGEAAPDPVPTAELTPRIEALVLGHLPGLAAAWAGQYARTIAGIESACMLVSLRGGRVSVEIHGVTDTETGGPCKTLDEALGLGRTLAATWLIRDDAGDAVADADSVTLLTGSDDAAIVAAYRELKSIKERRGGEREESMAVKLATPETRDGGAKEKIDRLARAAVSFLGASADTVLIEGLLGGGRRSVVYDGVHDGPGNELVDRIRSAAPAPRAMPERHAERPTELEPTARTPEPSQLPAQQPEPTAAPVKHASPDKPAVHIEPAPATPSITIDDLLDGKTRAVGDAEPETETSRPARRTLAEHLEGVMLAEARCPFAEEVELGLDAEGRLHLLIAATGADVPEAIETLESAQAWADEHRSLLKLTSGLGSMRPEHRPVAHLFTDQPKRVRRLLSSATRLHLLHHAATATGESISVCLELN